MKTLIKNGTIVTAADTFRGDVLIDGETVAALGAGLQAPDARVLDARERMVIPGGIDVHTHLDMPFGGAFSTDDFQTGTIAAAFGGTTCIVDFAIQEAGGTLRRAFDTWQRKAAGKAVVDYGFHMILRAYSDAIGAEMAELVAQGVTSFKLFTAYPGVFYLDDGSIFRALGRARDIGALICVHAENGLVIAALVQEALARGDVAPRFHALTRPPLAEAEATRRVIRLAQLAGAPLYVVHLSAAEALDEVRAARAEGAQVMAETCPQYLFLSHENYEEPGFAGAKYVMSPPLRSAARQEELWRGLRNGELQAIATDHCPFNFASDKQLGREDFSKIPNGAPGIETRMSLTYDGGVAAGRFSVNRWVELTATAPARIFGLFPRKGTIAPGSDADIVIFNPGARTTISARTHHMNVDYNPYEGRTVTGVPETVLSRGEVIIENGRFLGKPGRGRYLKRAPQGAGEANPWKTVPQDASPRTR